MRLLKELPEVLDKLKENKVNLSTLTQLQSHIKREEKLDRASFSKESKLNLLQQIEGKSEISSKRELLKNSKHPEVIQEKEKIITEDITEIGFGADNETMEKFRQLKDRMAHKNPNPSWQQFFKTLADLALKGPSVATAPVKQRVESESKENSKVNYKDRRHIPKKLKQCKATFAVEIDHIRPFALGGETTEENLRLLCRAHNRFRAEEVFGRFSTQ